MEERSNICHRVCTRDRVREEIVRRILDGRYPPEMHLKEMALAKDFGTSQAPVREALRDLEALGLVENVRYRGTRVRSSSAIDIKDAYELRALIESRAAQMAVPCKQTDLDVLSLQVSEMRDAAAIRDAERYSEAALIFHRRIVEMSGNRQFLKTFDSMLWEVRSRVAIYHALDDLPKHAVDHAQALALLKSGDGQGAGALLGKMLTDIIRYFEKTE